MRSPFNLFPTALSEAAGIGNVKVNDVTLRDGEQASSAAFTTEEKLTFAADLAELGVDQVQVGFSPRDLSVVRAAKQTGLEVPLEVICLLLSPTWKSAVDEAIAAGADCLHFVLRSADPHLALLGLTRDGGLALASEAVSYARARGAQVVTCQASLATLADPDFLVELAKTADHAGAQRVYLSDTLGICRPTGIREMVQLIRASTSCAIGVHCHNDFGLAVACALAGLEGGATWVDATIGGLGERAGNTSLEQLVMALDCLYGINTSVRTEKLYGISRVLARMLDQPVPAAAPVAGDDAFAQKLDVHVEVAKQDPSLFEPYEPSRAGNTRHIRLGKGSGAIAVGQCLADLDIATDGVDLSGLVDDITAVAEREKRYVTGPELLQMWETRAHA